MPLKDPFAQECLEKLQLIGKVTARAMFGGYGYYCEGTFFALIAEESQLCFRCDEESISIYENAGANQWIYAGHSEKPPTKMPYFCPPGDFLLNPQELEKWANLGLDSAKRVALKKQTRPKRKSKS